MELKDKRAIVTGSGRGIGRAIAVNLASEGASVALLARTESQLQEGASAISATGGEAITAAADIADETATRAAVEAVFDHWGAGADILVNNAALLTEHTMFLETDPDACMREIAVILHGTMHCSRAVLPGMIERGGGKIVNIATDAARVGQEREANYSAAKGGVIAFTKSLAKEVGRHNVNVNVVSPGATNSPMRIGLQQQLRQKLGDEAWKAREAKVLRLYPLRRIGEMEDITNTVLFMTSDAARHITGQVLSVNGGFAMA